MASDSRENAQWKRFNGENQDGKEYRKWRLWVEAKMASAKDISDKQRGPFVYCLLDGVALEAVEHVSLEMLTEEKGDKHIWSVLDERFPDKQKHDWMAECLREVFQITSLEGETMTAWTSRVQDVFSKCKRKVNVDFPTEARGWICLHASGLNEDQRAIVTAKTQGDLKLDSVMAAMRACFPDFKAPSKMSKARSSAAYVVEQDVPEPDFGDDEPETDPSDSVVQEVEAFLADHGVREETTAPSDAFEEAEVAEILAATWKEKRNEISRLQKSRRFSQALTVKKQFTRDAADLRRKSKCWNCGKVGHWSKDCTAPRTSSKPSGSTSDSERSKKFSAAMVVHAPAADDAKEVLLVSSPGYGIVDSGCSKTLVGQETLNNFMRLFHRLDLPVPTSKRESNLFKFGNGSEEMSERVVTMPVGLFGRRGTIEAAVIKGEAPLLLSRATMKSLQTKLDFDKETISLLGGVPQPMQYNEAGQIIINMLDFQAVQHETFVNESSPGGKQSPQERCQGLTRRESRVLLAQQKAWNRSSGGCLVAELFSPPRFSAVAAELGEKGLSYDIQQGWDLTKPSVQRQVSEELDQAKPDLLVVCPECKHWGGWYRLNQKHLSMEQQLLNRQYAKKQVDFCVQEIKKQLKRGGRILIEHPWSSDMWKYEPLVKVTKSMFKCRADMCAYGLVDPDGTPILKPTALMVSHADMQSLALTCPGHHNHTVVAGKGSDGENISSRSARYTPQFCRTWLSCVHAPSHLCSFACLQDQPVNESATADSRPEAVETCVSEVLAVSKDPEHSDAAVLQSLRKLHNNLGHPSDKDLVRILRNAGATEQALALAKDFEKQCSICIERQRPTPCLPASPSVCMDFNHKVGLDVKIVPGWKVNQRVKCLNVVDYASSYQVMLPFFEVETADVLRRLFKDGWLRWAGSPVEVLMDPGRTNMADSFVAFLEQSGTRVSNIAAEAHNQLGKVEKHGHLFEVILQKVLDQIQPQSQQEYEECVVQAANSKNELINNKGLSPCQLVFGRNPRVPADLLQDWPCPVAASSPLHDEPLARARSIRASARVAVVMSQDDKTLRVALNARPRAEREFLAGDLVCYWRTQKYQRGVRLVGGRWWGTAVVLGKVGRNFLVFHRKNMFKVSPEHLRHASMEERLTAQTDGRELLGLTDLVDKGQNLLGHQFVDLTNQDPPPALVDSQTRARPTNRDHWIQRGEMLCRVHVEPRTHTFMPDPNDPVLQQVRLDDWRLTAVLGNCQCDPDEWVDFPWSMPDQRNRLVQQEPWTGESRFWILPATAESKSEVANPAPMPTVPEMSPAEDSAASPDATISQVKSEPYQVSHDRIDSASPGTYGPVRLRQQKGSDTYVFRPVQTQPEDMRDAIQELAEERVQSHKRSQSREPSVSPPGKSSRTGDHPDECLLATCLSECPSAGIEVLVASFLKKKMQKELHHSNNTPELQEKIDASKLVEWNTLLDEKQAIVVIPPHEAANIRKHKHDRIMSSRFVITEKQEDNASRVKSRWCLRGHHDPDLVQKVLAGKCHSPTLSQLGRSLVLQLIVSHQWTLGLGDIKGAFLEANVLEQALQNPVYAELPPGGVPGVPPGSLVQILGNIYGANDAPANWYKEFDEVTTKAGFTRSKFDSCLYWCYGPQGELQGVLGAHVDDTITGGQGSAYDKAIATLKQRFPFRKWRTGSGEFLGTMYEQDPVSKEITYSQKSYAESIKPIHVSRERARKYWLPATQKEVASLRAVNGALGWLSSQSRPDLAVQTSLSQQAFPVPTVQELLQANQAVRRAKQQSDLKITVPYIPPSEITAVFWSDAAFANTESLHTQGGWMLALAPRSFSLGEDVPIHCMSWRSYRLPRVVSSTLSGEAQSFAVASSIAEWTLLVLAEALDGPYNLSDVDLVLKRRKPVGVSDCRSLYDHLNTIGNGGTIDDKRTAIDIAIIRQSIKRCGLEPRWCPTGHMVADAFTKDKGEPLDLLRSVIRQGRYQLADEQTVLERKKEEKFLRQQKAHERAQNNKARSTSKVAVSESHEGA